jgi:redox-sensitive bicupin YhaK (pirin superfamily)
MPSELTNPGSPDALAVTTARSSTVIVSAVETRHGDLLRTRDLPSSKLSSGIDPFMVVSLYEMKGPTFPPHPHAGFSVATYILPESEIGFINQDSLGHRNRISPGSLHWTTAGSGVLHEEQPERTGGLARGFQIWIDLPDAKRECPPEARSLSAADVPVLRVDGTTVRVVLGTSNGLTSPLVTPNPVRLVDVALAPGARFAQSLDGDENAFGFVLDGELITPGGLAGSGHVAVTAAQGDGLIWSAGSQGARFVLFAGTPHTETRIQHGPFVARDRQQMARFVAGFSTGAFGHLTSFADAPYLADD